MRDNKKVFLSVFGMLMVGCVFCASAQTTDSAVLFKIHDVQPVKNSEGLTVACDFNATVYNRSDKDITSAALLLTWVDTTVNNIIDDEKKEDAKLNMRPVERAYSQTQASSSAEVSTSLDIPNLKPYKQVSLRSRLQSDRCFILMEDVKVEVKKCQLASEENSRGSSGGNCDGLFRFVSPQNPEYYKEFKPISYDEEKSQAETKRNQDRRDINVQYDVTIAEMEKTSKVLEGIKADVEDMDVKELSKPIEVESVSDDVLSAKLKTLFPGSQIAPDSTDDSKDKKIETKDEATIAAPKVEEPVKTEEKPVDTKAPVEEKK